MNKIRQHFSTLVLTKGLFIALVFSAFIYLEYFDFTLLWLNSLLGILALYLLLREDKILWFSSGFFIGFFWFWWIAISLKYHGMLWAVPIELLVISLSYAFLFFSLAWLAEKLSTFLPFASFFVLFFKALVLLGLSYIHPFGFDWFKAELIFVQSYIGIEKWQFALVLGSITLSLWRKNLVFLLLIALAYSPYQSLQTNIPKDMTLFSTHISVSDKWNKSLQAQHFASFYQAIDEAIESKKKLIVLPESVFPLFLNREPQILALLKEKSKAISIVTGGLYWDGSTPHNSTYIFQNGKVSKANKVLLVPFGEANPLPDFLSEWVNKVFYDGAIDYQASDKVSDYSIDGVLYRNAICFEATSEKLYEGNPQNMIVLSNNAWFVPSSEATLQKLLLKYYSRKYGTKIYHVINGMESYVLIRK